MTAFRVLLLISLAGCATAPRQTELAFTYHRHQILVEGTVAGSGPLSFIVDTGVTPSVIDRTTATSIGVQVDLTQSGQASGAGSEPVTVHRASIRDLRVGDARFETLEAVTLDLTALSKRLGRPLHGILGDNFLRGRVVRIDYAAQRMTISREPIEGSGVELPFTTAPDDIIPIVAGLDIDGRTIPVSLDTGSSLGIELYPEAVELLRLQEMKAAAASSTIAGARGEAAVRKTTIDGVRLAGRTVNAVPVTFSERRDHGPERLGNVGNAFLENFVVTFDFVRRRVRFE
jgi:predicted aspartyl protease